MEQAITQHDDVGAQVPAQDNVKLKQHKLGADQFEQYVFFSHVINGVTLTLSKDITVEFKMTQADRSLSVGEWGGEGLAKIPKTDKKVIEAIMSHPLYTTRKEITRIPSLDEISYHKARAEGQDFIKKYKEGMEEGIFQPFDFATMKLLPLQALANKCGISAFDIAPVTFLKGGEKTKAVIVKELEAAFNQEK